MWSGYIHVSTWCGFLEMFTRREKTERGILDHPPPRPPSKRSVDRAFPLFFRAVWPLFSGVEVWGLTCSFLWRLNHFDRFQSESVAFLSAFFFLRGHTRTTMGLCQPFLILKKKKIKINTTRLQLVAGIYPSSNRQTAFGRSVGSPYGIYTP